MKRVTMLHRLIALLALLLLAGLVAGRAAAQDAYPPAEATPTLAAPAESFQPSAGQPDPLATPPAYPEPADPSVAPIGEPPEAAPAVMTSVPAIAPSISSSGLLYLWLGFLATLLILAASVIGAILLFVRRNEPG